jgi:hypothetical protein
MNGADNMRHNPLHAPGRSMGSVDALSQGVPPIVLLGEARQMTGVMSVNWSQNSVGGKLSAGQHRTEVQADEAVVVRVRARHKHNMVKWRPWRRCT